MSQDPLDELGAAIEKARGFLGGGRKGKVRVGTSGMYDRVGRIGLKAFKDGDWRRFSRAAAAQRKMTSRNLNERLKPRTKGDSGLRRGIYKSLDELSDAIEKALRINGGVKVSPAQRRKLATSSARDKKYNGGQLRRKFPRSSNVGARGPIYVAELGRAKRRASYAKPGQVNSKYWQRSNAAVINAFRRGRGEMSPYKRTLFGGLKRIKKSEADLSKAKAKTLYVYRPVENAEDILAWARGQGFKSTLPPEKVHVTLIASETELNWATLFDDHHIEPAEERKSMCDCGPVYRWEDRTKTKTIEGGVREVKKLGEKGAVVLGFESLSLTQRWIDLRRAGAVSKFSSFQPHLTITLSGEIPKDVQPYNGPIVLGEECWEEYKDGAYANVEEVVTKAALDAITTRLAAVEKAQAEPAKEAA